MKKLKFCLIFCFLTVVTLSIFNVSAATVASGTCGANGDNLTWVLDESGVLTISGSGDMENYISDDRAPWYLYRDNINKVDINEGATSIGDDAFCYCDNLTSIVIPNSVTSIIGDDAFYSCYNLTIYGTKNSTAETYATENNIPFKVISEFNSTPSQYTYDTPDIGETINVSQKLNSVTNKRTAETAIKSVAKTLTDEQKKSATAIDKMTVLAEGATANAASTTKAGDTVHITQTVVKKLEPKAAETTVDTVKVETNFASVSIPAEEQTEFELTQQDTNKVEVKFNNDKTTVMKISFPGISGDTSYMAVVDGSGKAIGGKYNPATGELEAKISASGVYSVVYNEKDFEDIKNKSAEMQNAIKTLAAKGIINGTSETTFSPDSSISRAEIAALVVRTLSVFDPNEDGGFVDVTKENWYFGVAGTSRKYGIINGYEDNTFRGKDVILKEQIIAVAARILRNEMNYKTPENISEYLTYADAESLSEWSKEDIALAGMANIVLQRVDGKFVNTDEMTRGDAAIILMRLFNKIW